MKCTMTSRYPFPFVECDLHPGPQHGFVICKHILYGTAQTRSVYPASDTELGEILCEREHDSHELCVMCGEHAKQWLP